jgi:pimeloyl-ACP methyl ester carboxylesterase
MPTRRQALLAAASGALLGLGGCQLLPRKPVTPMPLLRQPGPGPARAETLVVMLPGAYSLPQEFVDEGYVRALRAGAGAGARADVWIADAHLGYFNDRSVLRRLRDDVIAPARAQGYKRLWLVGISLGGFGALAYASAHGRDPNTGVDGVLAVAPYVGSRRLQGEMIAAGGPEAWADAQPANAPDPSQATSPDEGERALWRWLARPPAGAPPVYLGYGTDDRLADGHRLLAGVLSPTRVSTVPGGHDWPPWLALWQQWLQRGLLDAPLS